MSATPTQIIAGFTEFAAVADPSLWITMGEDELTPSQWGGSARYFKAVAFIAMHYMTKAGLSAATSAPSQPATG